MHKITVLLLLILSFQVSFAQSNDSLAIEEISKEIEDLKVENLLLKKEVEVLDSANKTIRTQN